VSTPAATNQTAILEDRGFQIASTSWAANAKLGTCGERGTKQFILPISFCARTARPGVIDSVSRRHRKMRDFGDERVHQLTLCPNSDAGMIVAFADKAWSPERETVGEALKAVREVKRSAMRGAQSAPYLESR